MKSLRMSALVVAANSVFIPGVGTEFVLARAESDGSPDLTFGVNGVLATGILMVRPNYRVIALAEGKILLAGSTPLLSTNPQFSVFRFLADGAFDLSFGTNGRTDIVFAGFDQCWDAAVGNDGKILLVGKAGVGFGQACLARLNPDGSPDLSFGPDGKVVSNLNGNAGTHYLVRVRILPDGKILGVGYDFASNRGDFFLVRYTLPVTGVEESSAMTDPTSPRVFPNPSRDESTIRFQLPGEGVVNVEIFDAAGRSIRSVFGGELASGAHAVRWDGRDDVGQPVSTGIFFARISSLGTTRTVRLARVR